MLCKVNATGELFDCTVASEAPVGLGFGAAALKRAPLFKMKPVSIDGNPVSGASVEVPIIFRVS